jgi:chromosome segregation ATPase
MSQKLEEYINELIQEREELLNAYPELRAYQKEIEETLEGITDPIERSSKLTSLLLEKVQKELLPGKREAERIKSNLRKLKQKAVNKKDNAA